MSVPRKKSGDAPTFKEDGTFVEIHHEGQNPDGPYKEMHRDDHRGGEGKPRPDKIKNSDKQFDTKEERRVITGSEMKTGNLNGEIPKGTIW